MEWKKGFVHHAHPRSVLVRLWPRESAFSHSSAHIELCSAPYRVLFCHRMSPSSLLCPDATDLVALPRRRRPAWADHLADEGGAHLGGRLILGQGDISKVRRVADYAAVGVACDIGPPLPRRRVWMSRTDVLGLQPLELLLRSQFVCLDWLKGLVSFTMQVGRRAPWGRVGHLPF